MEAFTSWLQDRGSDLKGCTFQCSEVTPDAGWAVYGPQNTLQGPILAVPLPACALTARRILEDPEFGPLLQQLRQSEHGSDRMLIVMGLLLEKARGPTSAWAPYLAVLPQRFDSPLHYSESELAELAGTTLHAATAVKLVQLRADFEQVVEPVLMVLLQQAGLSSSIPTFQDFLWAYSAFWSRVLEYPGTGLEQEADEDQAGSLLSHHSFIEGLVPGLDFCNHDPAAAVEWRVDDTAGSATEVPNSMYLQPMGQIEGGAELCFSYGPKPNEELLFQYGFVHEDNPVDSFVLHYPVAWWKADEDRGAKGALLDAQALSLRWTFPARYLSSRSSSEAALPGTVDQDDRARIQLPNSADAQLSSPVTEPPVHRTSAEVPSSNRGGLPEGVLEAFRVLALTRPQVLQVIQDLEEEGGSEEGGAVLLERVGQLVQKAVGDHTALQLLERLFNLRVEELEVTGSVEEDECLLQRAAKQADSVPSLSRRTRASVVYRLSQKRQARDYLLFLRARLDNSVGT